MHKMCFFFRKELDIDYCMSKAAATTVKPFSLDWNSAFESMLVGQDQVSAIISSVNNTLDPQLFYDALRNSDSCLKVKDASQYYKHH